MATLKDSGERREFESGAVRDIQEGKGRCDLLPLGVAAHIMPDEYSSKVLYSINRYIETQDPSCLYAALFAFMQWTGLTSNNPVKHLSNTSEMLLEVSKHYEDGAVKYGERNWEKGINVHCFIDSGVRHFLKLVSGWNDEPHDRAFVWNILGALWTIEHYPQLCDCSVKDVINK